MMKRMAYKDETGYHLHIDLDESPVKRLFELKKKQPGGKMRWLWWKCGWKVMTAFS